MIRSANIIRDGVTLAVHGGGNGLSIREVRGLGGPLPRRETEPRPSAHGTIDRTRYYEGRILELDGHARADTIAGVHDLLEELKGHTRLGAGELVLELNYGDADAGITTHYRRATVKVAGELAAPLAGLSKRVRWAVPLLASDPRLYAAEETDSYLVAAITGGTISFPLELPLELEAGASATLQVENAGTVETPAELEITGPALNPGVRNETTGEALLTNGFALGAGDELVLDTATRRVLLNGVPRPELLDVAASSWLDLAPGANELRLIGSGLSIGVSALSVKHRPAYL